MKENTPAMIASNVRIESAILTRPEGKNASSRPAITASTVVNIPAIEHKEDTVEISHRAKARLLRTQGLTISEIAAELCLDINAVRDYIK